MTSQIDRGRGPSAAHAHGVGEPARRLATVAETQAAAGARMQRGLGFDAVTASEAARAQRPRRVDSALPRQGVGHQTVTDILRQPKITALARMIRDQADAEAPGRSPRAAAVMLASVASAAKALANLCFFFDPTDNKPHLGHRNPKTGDITRVDRGESMKVDTAALARALDALSLEVVATGELKSAPIVTANAIH